MYTWQPLIRELEKKAYVVNIVARDHGPTLSLLDVYGLQYRSFQPSGTRAGRILSMSKHFYDVYRLSRDLNPSIVIGFGVDAAVVAAWRRKPCILFIDDDHTPWQNRVAKLLASAIITPNCFGMDLGRNHVTIAGFKEIAYLHPKRFMPDPSVLHELGVAPGEKYVIVRYNSWTAVHDIGRKTFSSREKVAAVRSLEEYCRVFVSDEGALPESLEANRLPTSPHRIHHALYYAQAVLGNTGTLSVESAVLGTPAVMCLPSVWRYGNYTEIASKYELLFIFADPQQAIDKTIQLVQMPNLKETMAQRRQKLLADMIDVTEFFVDFVCECLKRQDDRP